MMNQGYEEVAAHLHTTREHMETLILHDESSNGQHQSPSLSSSLPFAEISTDDDPLLSSASNLTHPHQNPNSFNSFLEPPSYADAIFRSFDGEDHDDDSSEINGRDLSPTSSSSFGSDYIRISVLDPQKEQEVSNSLVPGSNTYFTYLITTRTNLPEFNGSEFAVRRRFKDVVTLADRLSETYRGYCIPVRPDKSVVESQVMQQLEFVEHRRAALEKYLRRLAMHPVIKRSEELRLFLQVDGRLPLVKSPDVTSRMLDGAAKLPWQLFGGESISSAIDLNEVAQPAKGGRDLLRMFKELKQSVTNDWGGVKPVVVEEDKEFLERRDRLQDFEHQISNASQQVFF